MQVKSSDNLCVMCGGTIPEGRQTCPSCESSCSCVNGEVEQAFREGYTEGVKRKSDVALSVKNRLDELYEIIADGLATYTRMCCAEIMSEILDLLEYPRED